MNNKTTTVIYHSADFDGIFCREIARKFLGNEGVEYIGWDHGDKPLDEAWLGQRQLVILDLPVDRVFGLQFRDGWICRGGTSFSDEQVQPIDRWDSSNVTWIDHHKSSIETHPTDIPGYRIDGVSACRLAWQWFAAASDERDEVLGNQSKDDFIRRRVSEPEAVRLAGEYDVWDKRDPNAEVFQLGLRSKELLSGDWERLLVVPPPGISRLGKSLISATIHELLDNGLLLQDYVNQRDAQITNALAFVVEFEGLKFLALNSAAKGSLQFTVKDVPETGHEALLKFNFTGKFWDVSLYHAKHRTDLDLSAIAAKHGGGGHRGACGFRADKLPFLP